MPELRRARQGRVTESEIEAVGPGPAVAVSGRVNFVLSGVFAGAFRLAASWDSGASWIPVTTAEGAVRTLQGPERLVIDEPEDGVLYRVECLSLTSGAATWRFSR
jgi:hypothetical protein